MLLCIPAVRGSDLAELAGIDGASGDEVRVISFIRESVGGVQRIGANGSLVATFGEGAPRTLLIAGVDEPGFAVSGIHEKGYLSLHALAGPKAGTDLGGYFRGQHVRVSTRAGAVLPGVVAVPSVHFRSATGWGARNTTRNVLVDVGASTREEAVSAGISIVDRVTLDKRVAFLSDQWLASPWISSRSGAAILMALAGRLQEDRVEGTVILAFVAQQYPHNAGLARVLGSVEADRVLLLAPNGSPRSVVAPAAGTDPDDSRGYVEMAKDVGLRLERKPSYSLQFGPFGDASPWKRGQSVTVFIPAVRNGGTPSETVSTEELDLMASLLALAVGLPVESTPAGPTRAENGTGSGLESARGGSPTFEETISALLQEPGVSGDEGRVRRLIEKLVSPVSAGGTRVDSKGNLIVRLGAASEPSAAFIAHMDEIGYEVQSVLADGSVSVSSRGGSLPEAFAWQPVSVHAASATLPAVTRSGGLLGFGGVSREQLRASGVREGDSATVTKRYSKLLGDRISGRSLDDRLGCAVLLEAIRRLSRKGRRARGAVDFVFSVEEETGLLGARHYMRTARPSRVYPIDTFVTSDTPFGPDHLAPALLGAGAVLRAIDQSGMTLLSEVERVLALAKRAKIPVQVGVTAGGNDGSVFKYLETVNIPIGFPLRYAHSPVETADLRDAKAVSDLVEALALEELGLRR